MTVASLVLATAVVAAEPPRMSVQCPGLESYDIRLTMGPHHAGGPVRSRVDKYEASVVFGPGIGASVPENNAIGFRWVKTEQLGDQKLRYGRFVKTTPHRMVATLHGPSRPVFNLSAPWSDDAAVLRRFLSIARTLAKSDCKWTKVD